MKTNFFFGLISLLLCINSNGQACGRYMVRIIGTINSKDIKFEKIKIPRISTLEYKTNSEISVEDFKAFKIDSNKIEIRTQSSLGSIFHDAESLKKKYMKTNKVFKFFVIANKTEIQIEIEWDKIEIIKTGDNKFGTYFEFNLGAINIEIN